MHKRLILSLLIVGLGLLGSFELVAGGLGALAVGEERCDDTAADGPFLGIADPNAPYDLRFVDDMVMHHRGAIMSAEMMIADSEHPELRDLARRIQESQQRQIEQMLAWRAQWYPAAATPAMSMKPMDGMMSDDGMMGGGMMRGMIGPENAAEMFLRMMIPHHQLAVEMAEDALINAEHKELKDLSREIIAGQSAEIKEMEGYLRAWYGADSTHDAAGAMGEMMQGMMGGC